MFVRGSHIYITALSNLVGIGGISVMDKLLGRHKYDEVKKVSSFSFWAGVVMTALFCGLTFAFAQPLLSLLSIGAETARALAANGAKVVLSARREERLKALAAEIGENAAYLKTDVSSLADMLALVSFAKEKFGKVDTLFANAGVMPAGNMSELKTDDWARMVQINIMGVLNAMAAVLPEFIAQKRGHIVVTSSVAGTRSVPSAFKNVIDNAIQNPRGGRTVFGLYGEHFGARPRFTGIDRSQQRRFLRLFCVRADLFYRQRGGMAGRLCRQRQ